MKIAISGILGIAAVSVALIAGHAVAGGYDAAPYGGGYGPSAGYGAPYGGGYGPGAGYGAPYGGGYGPSARYGLPYGGPQMAYPPRPQRPEPPARPLPPQPPQMGPYGYGNHMGRPNAPGGYGMTRGYDAGRSNNAIPAAAPAKTAASTETSDAATVTISQMRFNAPTITIKVGGRVTWTNSEGIPHTVTADDESFGSSRLSAGETFSYTFNEPGTYTYYCQLHPMMRATVVVEA